MSTKKLDTGGPLVWPVRPPDGQTMSMLAGKLHGHTTAANWLPEGVWPELDELRAEQLRLRGVVAADIDAWHALAGSFRAEDAEFDAELRQAYRDGFPPPGDARTPDAERKARLCGVEDRLWAGAAVFAEHADQVIATIRENEEKWLGTLRSRAAQAEEKVREAQRIADEAKTAQWHVAQLGRWLQHQTDDVGFSRQPAPDGSTPRPSSAGDQMIDDALERPWHRAIQAPVIQPLGDDPSQLDPEDLEIGTDLIEPLGPTPEDATTQAPGRFRMREVASRGSRGRRA